MSERNSAFALRPPELLHTLLREVIREGDQVIDATSGNGYDTVMLAECVGANGRVLAFDVQAAAIAAASARVKTAGFSERVEFFEKSHVHLADHTAAESVSAVVFNLGYLPGDDHGQTTTAEETLAALTVAKDVLKPAGLLAVVCYPGHPAGAIEAAAVEEWMIPLTSQKWWVVKYGALGTLRPAPFLLIAQKR